MLDCFPFAVFGLMILVLIVLNDCEMRFECVESDVMSI